MEVVRADTLGFPIVYDDITYSLQRAGGISLYWTELLKRSPRDAKHIIFDNAKTNLFYDSDLICNERIESKSLFMLKRYKNIEYNFNVLFLFHSSYYRFCKSPNAINVTTVHDFTYEMFDKRLVGNLHKIQKRRAIMHSKGVICISENTKRDLLKFYPEYHGKIVVIYNGYDIKTYYVDKDVEKEKVIVFVGARTYYKRFDIAVEIVSLMPEYRLEIVGGGVLNAEEKTLLDRKLSNRYHKHDFVSNDELRKIYNRAFCLIYPSEYEGFGIPVIEAQACGCPVVCQALSSIPEVAGDAGVYISSKDDILENVKRVERLKDSAEFERVRQLGLDNVKRFSWDKCAEETQKFYREIVFDE